MEISYLTVFLIFLITTAVVTVCVFNSIIYYEIFNNNEPDPTISFNTAKIYFGINVGVGAVVFGLWLWSIYKMLPSAKFIAV
jgi:hypothetical protein